MLTSPQNACLGVLAATPVFSACRARESPAARSRLQVNCSWKRSALLWSAGSESANDVHRVAFTTQSTATRYEHMSGISSLCRTRVWCFEIKSKGRRHSTSGSRYAPPKACRMTACAAPPAGIYAKTKKFTCRRTAKNAQSRPGVLTPWHTQGRQRLHTCFHQRLW